MGRTRKMIAAVLLASMLFILLSACAQDVTAAPVEPQSEAPAQNAGEKTDLTVKKLEIAKAPDKTTYVVGEQLDDSGAIVNAIMSDDSVVENVPYTVELGEAKKNTHSLIFCYEGKMVYQYLTILLPGNAEEYWVENTEAVPGDPLSGKKLFFLGSSVTFGAQSEQEAIPEFMDKIYGTVSVKEARSGTTLAISKEPRSYVERLDEYIAGGGADEVFDAFICQLSTNDTSKVDDMGQVMPNFLTDASGFDKTTTIGAIEYIIATVKETWDCPVIFYTNTPYGLDRYGQLVEALYQIADKWDVTIIDLYNDEAFNDIPAEEYDLYMADSIHPTRAGYRDWWLPRFHDVITEVLIGQLAD